MAKKWEDMTLAEKVEDLHTALLLLQRDIYPKIGKLVDDVATLQSDIKELEKRIEKIKKDSSL